MYGADAGRCPRLNAFYSVNTEIPFEADSASVGYMAIGDALEGILANGLRSVDSLVASNFRLLMPTEAPVSGKIDLIFYEPDGGLSMGEVKSCGDLPASPKWTHQVQAETYAVMSGIPRAYLIYVSRNVQKRWGDGLAMQIFKLDVSEAALESRIHTIAASHLATAKGIVPPKPAHFRKSVECYFCSFQGTCWGEDDLEMLRKLRFIQTDEVAEKFEAAAEKLAGEIRELRPLWRIRTLTALATVSESDSAKEKLLTEANSLAEGLETEKATFIERSFKEYKKGAKL